MMTSYGTAHRVPETLSLARWLHDNPDKPFEICGIPAKIMESKDMWPRLQLVDRIRDNGVYVVIDLIRYKSGKYYLDCNVQISDDGQITLGPRDTADIKLDMEYLEELL